MEVNHRLRRAVIDGNLHIVQRLTGRFPSLWLDPDPSHRGWLNLHYASYHGHYLVCFHLILMLNKLPQLASIKSNALDLLTFDGLSVLHLAIERNHSQTLHYLLQEFPGQLWVNHRGGPLLQSPLHYCAVHGFKEGAELCVQFGADPCARDANGDTPLHLAFQYGHMDVIRVLVRVAASPDAALGATNARGCRPTDHAPLFEFLADFELLRPSLTADTGTHAIFTPPQAHDTSMVSHAPSTLINSVKIASNADPKTRQHLRSLPLLEPPPLEHRRRANTTTSRSATPSAPPHTPVIDTHSEEALIPASIRDVTILPSTRKHEPLEELPQLLISVLPLRKKSSSISHVFTMPSFADDLFPPRKDSLAGSPVLQPPVTTTPELVRHKLSIPSFKPIRLESLSSLIRRSPSNDHQMRRPSLMKILTMPKKLSRESSIDNFLDSPTLRKSKSSNGVYISSLALSSSSLLLSPTLAHDDTLTMAPRPRRESLASVSFSRVHE